MTRRLRRCPPTIPRLADPTLPPPSRRTCPPSRRTIHATRNRSPRRQSPTTSCRSARHRSPRRTSR
eukprot:3313455-Heterocapsa_arctica.AAC.1